VSDEPSGYPGAPPGWYPDPAGGPGQRWWDGYAWNEATVLPAHLQPPAPTWEVASQRLAAVTASGQVADARSMARLARFSLPFAGVSTLLLLLYTRLNAGTLREFGHQFHRAVEAGQQNVTPPPITVQPISGSFGAVVSLVDLLGVAALIINLIWQHRAATAARALNLPARRSPGLGVGGWFIPVCNFWFPYQAIRDCLPAEDPHRVLVLRWWLAYLGMGLFTGATLLIAMFNSSASLVTLVPGALCAVAVLASAPGVVRAVDSAQQGLVTPPV